MEFPRLNGDTAEERAGLQRSSCRVRTHLHKHSLRRRFELLETLGTGTYGKVKRAVERRSGDMVAIKTIRKEKIRNDLDRAHIRREIEITSSLLHPNIIRLYEVFESRERIVMVLEYAGGGELYDYIQLKHRLSEDEARHYFRQITAAVHYCHQNGVVHRDLKLENVLLDNNFNVKLADFGLSNRFIRGQHLDTFCGSPLYASPEIINGLPYHGPEVDCWSLGVLLYALVHGSMPFDGSSYSILKEQISQGQYKTPDLDSEAYSLIKWMLTVKVEERATVEDITNHWWLNLSSPELPEANIPRDTESTKLWPSTFEERSKVPKFTPNRNALLRTPIKSSFQPLTSKMPKKGILKKFSNQSEPTESCSCSCEPVINGNWCGVGTEDRRERKGILKCAQVNSLATARSHGYSESEHNREEMEVEIRISLRKTHESTGLMLPQNRFFDRDGLFVL
ncbi:hypothetical protein DNTS_035148 [Danionella cerebrum]|uniref:non-specific serine/threonine protein kinase n=1 Tax=Danionella cerebrum TaxID=2873325 RepID=A0A553N613_9TELE|nr:hypothetical protein DNTS_035148 [Danionella translucida]